MTDSLDHVETAPIGRERSRRHIPVWVPATLAAVASGGLMAACFRPLNLHWLAWVALVPWLVMLPRLSDGATWLVGSIVGLVFYRVGLDWGFGVNSPLAGALMITFAIWMGYAFRVAGMLVRRFGPAAMLWAVPLAFVGHEVIRCEAFPRLRIPFLALGYSQAGNLWIAQLVSLGGVYILGGLIVAVNAAIAYAILQRTRAASLVPAIVVAGIAALAFVSQPADYSKWPGLSVACVQAEGISLPRFVELTREALASPHLPRLVVLPEHTIETPATDNNRTVQELAALAREYGAYICVGAHTAPAKGAACPYDNVGLVIGPEGRIVAAQAKSVPLPFFEDGNPARSLSPISTTLGSLGVCVCYDALFTDLPRRLIAQGAELLVVPVMDPSPWPAQENLQHADMAPFRSIELRRCAVRAASSGESQIVDAAGRVRSRRTRQDGKGVLFGTVCANTQRTLFARGGFVLAPTAAGLFLLAVVWLTGDDWLARRRFRRASPPTT